MRSLFWFLLCSVVLRSLGVHSSRFNSSARHSESNSCRWQHKPYPVRAFWINLEQNKDRAHYMESLLSKVGVDHQRIVAITPNSSDYLVDKLEQPCKRNTPRDIAVILSHLKAMYTAVYHKETSSNDYALILEDDVKFLYDIDFDLLVGSAPKGFGILQLITSNVEAINSLLTQFKATPVAPSDRYWKKTAWNHFTKNGKTSLYWSAQAYLVNKRVIKPFIDDVITVDPKTGQLHFKIVNSFFPNKCQRTSDRPCILANCLFADSYIFSGGEPTYISTIPLFSGSRIGYTSTIHQEQVSFHQEAFGLIKAVTQELLRAQGADSSTLPPYLRQPVCAAN